MGVKQALALIDNLVYAKTEKPLSDLQSTIIKGVWQGKKYLEIADEYGCTEGHAKDIGADLWKILSEILDSKVTKSNLRSVIKKQLQSELNLDVHNSKTSSKLNYSQSITSSLSTSKLARFLGREEEIAALQTLVARGSKIILIQGEGGVGKTTLAQQFLSSQNFATVLEVLMAKETENIISAASIVEEWLQRDLQEESGKEFGVSLARLKRYLENHAIGILIDNLEPALDRNGKFIKSHRNYVELLRVLADNKVQSVTIITSRDRLCEADIDLDCYRLSGLDISSWIEFFHSRGITSFPNIVNKIHRIYGGNAKAMDIICGIIQQEYRGNLGIYWQENGDDPLVETNLKNLVASQFDRLQALDPQAYLLLCRLGCYRYQDLSTIPRTGLSCLLWDVEKTKQGQVIQSLRNRSLIEFDRGNYWLHPVIKTEAVSRLYSALNSEWQQTHRAIAKFWTESVSRINNIQDGLTALEAYHHYVAIANFSTAAEVILYSRDNKWGQYLTLGTTLFRLGLLQQLLTAILSIIDRVERPRYRSELNNILGDLYWTVGRVHEAIACQQITIDTANKAWQLIPKTTENQHDLYYWRMLEVDSLLSIGLYQIDLWELSAAASFFQQVIELAKDTKHHSWSEKAFICLALVDSYTGIKQQANNVARDFYRSIINSKNSKYNTGRFAYFMQIIGQIYLNLEQIEPAKIIFQRAIAFSQESHYTQIKAKSLTGLGVIDRQQNNFSDAIYNHQQAIQLLDNIGAKCDLAEAYVQLGLTLAARQKSIASQEYFHRAISLFKQVKAPKQIEKVLKLVNDCVRAVTGKPSN